MGTFRLNPGSYCGNLLPCAFLTHFSAACAAVSRGFGMKAISSSWLVWMLLLAVAAPAFAGLGGDVASIEADRVRMKASSQMVASPAYTVHEILTPSGTKVREYLSPAGQVFAVAWNGPFMPDLQQLLGPSYDIFQQAAQSRRNGRGPLAVNHPSLVAHAGGHMRAFSGRAYVPLLVPANVSLDEIK